VQWKVVSLQPSTGTKAIHVVVSTNVDTELLDLLDNFNYPFISEI
jgi:hypothetical protein